MKKQSALELIDYLYNSPTAFHAVDETKKLLDANGYTEVYEANAWDLKPQGKYYVTKNNTALIAFEIGSDDIVTNGIRMIGAHTDSPGFRIKPNPELTTEGTYLKLNTEVYGGPILHTWFDRPLAIAGQITLKSDNPFAPKQMLVNLNKPLVIIPSLAIHMNRQVNEGFKINAQKDTLPLVSLINKEFEKENYLLSLVANELRVELSDILSFELSLYEYEKGCLFGANEEFISSARLDDMWMVYAGLEALLKSNASKATKMMICIDNEEIGSLTQQGAASNLILNIIERVVLGLGKSREQLHQTLANSILISADLAHAVHPNVSEKHDPTNRPVLGGGPVLKQAASGSYSTDSFNGAIYESLCQLANIPSQKFVNRSDVRGGTTIGPVSASKLNIPVIDMGAPLLGMHSIRELASVEDHINTIKLFTTFFNA